MAYIYNTQAEAEAASNIMYLEIDPNGTTEMLYGWFINEDGKYQLGTGEE